MATESSATPSKLRGRFNTFLNLLNTCFILGIFILLIVLVTDIRKLTADTNKGHPDWRGGPVLTVDVRSVYDVVANAPVQTNAAGQYVTQTVVAIVTQTGNDVLEVTGRLE
jgi:hypothetical protein